MPVGVDERTNAKRVKSLRRSVKEAPRIEEMPIVSICSSSPIRGLPAFTAYAWNSSIHAGYVDTADLLSLIHI